LRAWPFLISNDFTEKLTWIRHPVEFKAQDENGSAAGNRSNRLANDHLPLSINFRNAVGSPSLSPDYSRCAGVKIEKACFIGHCSEFVVSTVHPRRELVNLQKLSLLQENRLKYQTRRLSS
jgi:hypothetical protein